MGSHRVGTTPSVGTRWPAHATSTGKVLLAALCRRTSSARAPAARRCAALTPRTITGQAALRRELERVRERGYATGIEELEPGFMAVGAPVRSATARWWRRSAWAGRASRLDPERLAGHRAGRLPRHAARISERLGTAATAGARPR